MDIIQCLLVLLFVFCVFMILVFADSFSEFLFDQYCKKIDKEVDAEIEKNIIQKIDNINKRKRIDVNDVYKK